MLADCLGQDYFPFHTTNATTTATTMMKSVDDVAQTPFETSDSVLERFYLHVKERPDAPYLTQPITGQETPTVYTFKDVYDEARMLAAHIQSYNLDKQSKIAVISKNCAHFFITELAIWMSGNVTVALFPNLAASTCQYILEHAEAKMVVLGKLDAKDWNVMKAGVPDGIPTVGMPMAPTDGSATYDSWESIQAKTTALTEPPHRAPDDEALIVYTSGSTGQPKGVVHTFQTISYPSKLMSKLYHFNRNDRYLSYLPLAHVMDRWLGLCCSLYNGYQVFFAESLTTFVQDLNRARPTLFISVPRLWLKFQLGVYAKKDPKTVNFLLKIPLVKKVVAKKILQTLGLDSVRLAGTGSAPIPQEVVEWYRTLGLSLLEGYGMSENFCYSHNTIKGMEKPGFVGSAQPGVEHKLTDEGEILMKGPGNMVGYYKAPDKTAEAVTADGFLRTGDRGIIDEQGRLKITGRTKELFKTSKGKYVAPAPIENILNNDAHIEMSLVCGSGQVMTMAVVQLAEGLLAKCEADADLKTTIETDMAALLKHANGEIEHHEKIGFIVIAKEPWTIEDGLLTPTMKIKRTQIEEKYEASMNGWYESSSKTKILFWE